MALAYRNLDGETRKFMVEEIDMDVASNSVYVSSYLNERGATAWPTILRLAASTGSDDTLGLEIQTNNYLKSEVQRRKPSGGFTTARVPYTANVTLGEGEFGRYYARGLCRRAISEGIPDLIVYRAKAVMQARPGSEEKIGTTIGPIELLENLRAMIGVEPSLGLPPGPNSGLTVRLP